MPVGVFGEPAFGGLWRAPQVREQRPKLPGRQWQRDPPSLVAFRQRVAQASVPSELVPSDQLSYRDVQWGYCRGFAGAGGAALRGEPVAATIGEEIKAV
jgi:ribosomal protein S30